MANTSPAGIYYRTNAEAASTLEAQSLALANSVNNAIGLVPLTPSSVVVNTGSASVGSDNLISFSGASSLSVNGVFTSLYPYYRILVTSYGSTLGIAEYFRLRSSGTDRSNANYYYGGSMCREGGTLTAWAGNGATVWDLNRTHTSEMTDTSIDIFNPAVSTKPTSVNWLTWANDSSGGFGIYCTGTYSTLNANDGFTIWLSSGTFGGTVKIYGYR